jgi:L-ribulokinase
MWHPDWGGLPSEQFLTQLDPLLTGLRDRLYEATYTSDQQAGMLTKEWADRLGLPEGIPVAVGALDAHMGAAGGGIKEKALVKIMGTSTCDMMVAPSDIVGNNLIEGICGQVDGSIIPGMIGFEAGQSAFGDVFAWFKKVLSWPLQALGDDMGLPSEVGRKLESRILEKLTEEASAIDPTETTVLALDWFNGRRTPWADPELKGALIGLTLGTDAPRLFRALVEATAFGSKATAEEFKRQGLDVREVIAQGGIPEKNPFVMQVTADVLNMPIKTVRSNQAVALGAAMFASVASGVYSNIQEAQAAMGSGYKRVYKPDLSNAAYYQVLYTKYLETGEKLSSMLRNL